MEYSINKLSRMAEVSTRTFPGGKLTAWPSVEESGLRISATRILFVNITPALILVVRLYP